MPPPYQFPYNFTLAWTSAVQAFLSYGDTTYTREALTHTVSHFGFNQILLSGHIHFAENTLITPDGSVWLFDHDSGFEQVKLADSFEDFLHKLLTDTLYE